MKVKVKIGHKKWSMSSGKLCMRNIVTSSFYDKAWPYLTLKIIYEN